jgi:hypothetical protein
MVRLHELEVRMKLLSHLLILAVGVGLGIWIGVRYPNQSQRVADTEEQQAAKIQQAVSQEKIALLQKFIGNSSNSRDADQSNAEYQQMLNDEKQKLQNANAKLGQ